jgi:hypothetical protein
VSRFAAASTWLVRGGEVAVALVAGAGAAAKLVDPRPAFELAEAVTASPWASAAVVATACAAEGAVAVAVLTGALRGRRAVVVGVAMMAVFIAWLLLARARVGGEHECGCVTAFRRGTVSGAITANAVVLAELATAWICDTWSRRGAWRRRPPDGVGLGVPVPPERSPA